jgi:hypothetical protein
MTTSRLQKVSRVKGENKRKISTYLNDPDNEWMNRTSLGVTICGYKDQRSLYRHFSPDELTEIENESLVERKRRSAGKRAVIYDAMFLKAKKGDVAAMKEYLDRTEGKVPNKVDANLQHEGTLNQELPDYILEMINGT